VGRVIVGIDAVLLGGERIVGELFGRQSGNSFSIDENATLGTFDQHTATTSIEDDEFEAVVKSELCLIFDGLVVAVYNVRQ
jgi:hypothetical protein